MKLNEMVDISATTRTSHKITYNGHTYYYGAGAGFKNWTNETSELHRYKSSATDIADAAFRIIAAVFWLNTILRRLFKWLKNVV